MPSGVTTPSGIGRLGTPPGETLIWRMEADDTCKYHRAQTGRAGDKIACPINAGLKLIPQVLVVDLVVVLNFLRFDDGAQQTSAAIRGRLLEIGVTALYVR